MNVSKSWIVFVTNLSWTSSTPDEHLDAVEISGWKGQMVNPSLVCILYVLTFLFNKPSGCQDAHFFRNVVSATQRSVTKNETLTSKQC